jgi:hypothetical protein
MFALLLLSVASAQEPWQERGWGWGGLPAVNYNSDEGLGLGAVGSVFRYDGEISPYRTAVNLVLFGTTGAVQTHSVEVDALQLGDRPLRLTAKAEFAATKTGNYCGTGPAVTCSAFFAEAAADQLGLEGEEREEMLRLYYRSQFLNPNAQINLRWAIDPMPHRVELLFGYRANGLIPGDLASAEPYPNSLYAEDFPGGERGLVSQAVVGVMIDQRDFEPAPTRGYWAEASVRAASKALGGDYDHVGFNLTWRGYLPLGTDRLVLADRVMADGLVGDAHTLELTIPGGFQRYTFFGSYNAGRGIRLRRYVGKVKAMNQAELRWTPWSPVVAGVPVDLTVLGFSDLGFVGSEFTEIEQMFETPLPTAGAGLRVAVDRTFVVRADVGVSPLEAWAPKVYLDLRNTF